MVKETFYITTPIYYANASPHIGSAYTTIAADILARWNRLLGKKVFFLTGTDEHGQKIQETANKAGLNPKKFVDEIAEKFKQTFKLLNISNDDFIRTTDKKHEEEVKKILQELYNKKLIYKGVYEALYCIGCEQYKTRNELIEGKCPLHKTEPQIVKEESYMFKLSNFQDNLIEIIKKDSYQILPEKRKNEVLAFIQEGLQDIAISRLKSKVSWGIELPFDKEHTCYVWVDAFWNYITGLKSKENQKIFWPPNTQLMANDILRVHATIWPALLLALDYKLPKTLFVHGYFTVNGHKMSKSLGNVISPEYIAEKYSVDTLRYYIMRKISFGHDGDFSEEALKDAHNNELANKLGNLVSRVSTLAEKYGLEKTKHTLPIENTLKQVEDHFKNYELHKVLEIIFTYIDRTNEYIQEKKPWEVSSPQREAPQQSEEARNKSESNSRKVLYELVLAIKNISILISPFMPQTAEKISKVFNFKISLKDLDKPLNTKIKIKKAEILFKKIT